MGEDGRIVYKIVIDSTGAVVEAERAGKETGRGFEDGAKPHAGAFKEMMTGAARAIGEAFVQMAQNAVQGVEQIVQAGVNFNAQMEQYQTAFTTLLGSAEEADKVMAQIRQDAASTPFDVDSLTQANQMLISAGISADQARDDVLNLANAISATGGSSAELSRMAANMQQIQNTGKATAMDIRQFANAGINIYALLADSMGVTTEEAAQMDVTYEQLAKALANAANEGGKYAGALEAQAQTFTGRMSTLKDNATQLAGELTSGLFEKLSGDALPMVMDWVATLLEAAQTGGLEGAMEAAREILSGLVNTFLENLPTMIDTGLELLEGLLNGIAAALPQIIPVVIKVITTILTGLLQHLPDLINCGMQILVGLINGIINALPDLIGMLPTIISTIVMVLIQNLPQLIAAGIEILLALGRGLLQAIPQLLLMLPQIIFELINTFKRADWQSIGSNIVTGIWEGIKGLWSGLVDGFTNSVSNLWQSAKNALGIASPSKKFK